MKKTCRNCGRNRGCGIRDKARGMPCSDYTKGEKKHERRN